MKNPIYWHRLAKALGYRTLPRRLWHAFEIRTGNLRRRLPPGSIGDGLARAELGVSGADVRACWRRRAELLGIETARAAVRAWIADQPRADDERARLHRRFESLQRGVIRAFDFHDVSIGDPPDFLRDPLRDVRWPAGKYWTDNSRMRPAGSELKLVWEPSRWAWAWDLLRISTWLDEPRAAELFWRWVLTWDQQNPYGLTPNWVCGQEATIRLMALLFGGCAFLEQAPNDEALERMTILAAHTARHIEATIAHTCAMRNNHSLSEAAGLITVGLMFPELKSSSRWAAAGRRILARELAYQFFIDGSYIQHSFNYHRLALDVGVWAWRIAERAGSPLGEEVRRPLERGLDFLGQVTDRRSGAAPNYGHNDGANILPLSGCEYRDYRPTLQTASRALRGERLFDAGPWDEKAVWLLGPAALESSLQARWAATFAAQVGGYFTLRDGRSWCLLRCHTYYERPAQADMLHVDLWHDGVNVFRDGGTFRYFAEEPWDRYFGSTAAHNTVEIGGADQMERGPRFLWFRWLRSQLVAPPDQANRSVVGAHFGYRRLPGSPIHVRGVASLGSDLWLIHDRVIGGGEHDVCLRWRLSDADWVRDFTGVWRGDVGSGVFALGVLLPAGFEQQICRGVELPRPEGWESTHYAQRSPAPTVLACGRAALPVEFVTFAGPGGSAFANAHAALARAYNPVPIEIGAPVKNTARFETLRRIARRAVADLSDGPTRSAGDSGTPQGEDQ